ncbi:hypothetical protein [Nonomuraea sp. NPDC050310]|uniref:hypothetical protein n=1 Tax=Nonomuraea sp. NPDC050310 TaxID=3154935 RepID=UPI0033CEE8C2
MPRARPRLARALRRLLEPAPQRPARPRTGTRHPRPVTNTTTRTARTADRARLLRQQAEIERLRAELAAREHHDAAHQAAATPRHVGRAVHWWTATGTALAGLAAVPALVISMNALAISEQQRADTHAAFIGRVALQPETGWASEILDGGQLVVTNANSMPTELFLSMKVTAGSFQQAYDFQVEIDACTQLTIDTVEMELDTSQGWEGINHAYVHNPLDGRWWKYPPAGDLIPAHPVAREIAVPSRYKSLPPAFESVGKTKDLSGCV